MLGRAVVVHLALQCDGGMVCTPVHCGSIHSCCNPMFLDEQRYGKIALEATLLSFSPIYYNDDGTVENSKGR